VSASKIQGVEIGSSHGQTRSLSPIVLALTYEVRMEKDKDDGAETCDNNHYILLKCYD
jgi:hypothetical protein